MILKRYGSLLWTVHRRFNKLIARQGDLVCLEGPVGGGKSAFLNAINGNLIRTNGSIHFEDVDAGEFPTLKFDKFPKFNRFRFRRFRLRCPMRLASTWHDP